MVLGLVGAFGLFIQLLLVDRVLLGTTAREHGILVQRGLVQADRRLRRERLHQALVLRVEHAGPLVAEQHAAYYLAIAELDGYGEVGRHREMPGRHAVMGTGLAVAWVAPDIVAADGRFAAERGPNRWVSRGSGNFEKCSRATPEMAYSV